MRELPILFNQGMVPAVLAGSKTQTRMPMKQQPVVVTGPSGVMQALVGDKGYWVNSQQDHPNHISAASPFGRVGDLLWVRETFATSIHWDTKPIRLAETPGNGYGWPVWYKDGTINLRGRKELAGGPSFTDVGKWRPAIHMPRWASRITLEVTGIRVERVQEIRDYDAFQEGVESLPGTITGKYCRSYLEGFVMTWDRIYGGGQSGWSAKSLGLGRQF